jgi:hypothetical protein
MTQEHKELLLKDLCSRLPYGVICKDDYAKVEGELVQIGINYDMCLLSDDYGKTEFAYIPNCKPYLFPLSSMTDGQKTEWDYIDYYADHHEAVNWLNKNHFDYRGLIDMGLALNATNKNIY